MELDEGVKWAADYVISKADAAGCDIEQEDRVEFKMSNEVITFGYFDAYYRIGEVGYLFDLKTGMKRDYVMQMCVYASALAQRDNLKTVHCYLLYSKFREVESFTVAAKLVEALVCAVVDTVTDPDKVPSSCDYCKWCADRTVCHINNPDRALKALVRSCEKNLGPLLEQYSKTMRVKDRNRAEILLTRMLSDLNIKTEG
jgi:hypothetical protein